MHSLKNKISPLLAIVFLQFTTPILNVAAELQCCNSENMQCCQSEFPARMVCCVGETAHGFDESAPSQMVLQKQFSQQTVLLFSPLAFISEPILSQMFVRSTHSDLHNSSLYNNDIYQKLSTLLI
ncbi:MAG: hypothetical protein ACE5I1_24685 [bacterium]